MSSRKNFDEDIKRWMRTHQIEYIDSRVRRSAVQSPISSYTMSDSCPINNFEYKSERTLILEVGEEKLYNLVEFERRVLNQCRTENQDLHLMFNRVMEREEAECEIRSNNPAVKKAWDHYQLLVKMAGNC